jgi:hypothetical protein
VRRQPSFLICAQFLLSLVIVYLFYIPHMSVMFSITIKIEGRDLIPFCSQFFYAVPHEGSSPITFQI